VGWAEWFRPLSLLAGRVPLRALAVGEPARLMTYPDIHILIGVQS
jgi:hypothetical protein